MTASSSLKQAAATGGRTVIGVADVNAVKGPAGEIVTYALGSCIGVTVYDPSAKVGGMLHFMLPSSSTNPEKANASPAMFADTGLPILFDMVRKLGANPARSIVCAAGGAEVIAGEGHFKIGSRNRTALRKLFWKQSILLKADDTGGTQSRTMTLMLADGTIKVKSRGKEEILWQP